ncbi:MAG: hypothetical protein RBT63_05280, partial [Bdellovibrionales bacterium]|nr:hypothetical protein [Bdellovibrionales bacterium]
KDAPAFDRLPFETLMPSIVRIQQNLDIRADSAVIGTGKVSIEGPLAAELKQLYFSQPAQQIEPYLTSLLGLQLKTESGAPIIRVNTGDRRGRIFELSYSYAAPRAITYSTHNKTEQREFDLSTPGISGIPLLARARAGKPARVTDLILSRNLTIESETKIRGVLLADETATSCLSLTSFASLSRETRFTKDAQAKDEVVLTENLRFGSSRIPANSLATNSFQEELAEFSRCLLKTKAVIGPRPTFDQTLLSLSQQEVETLRKPVSLITQQDIKILDDLNAPQLKRLAHTKIWLATRDMMRRGLRTDQMTLEYAAAILETGRTPSGTLLPGHVAESAKLFSTLIGKLSKLPKFHRVHANMLLSENRSKEATVALHNAILLENGGRSSDYTNQARDAMQMGHIYKKVGNLALAEKWYLSAIEKKSSQSGRTAVLENMAAFRLSQGRTKDFTDLYNQAIKESPRNVWLHIRFAEELLKLKLWDHSIQQSRAALSITHLQEAEALLANALIGKAASLYYASPDVITDDPKALAMAERLALETLRHSRDQALAYRIAGHLAFNKAMTGDYGSLIAAQSYLAKALELGLDDSWTQERYSAASQALDSRRGLKEVWAVYVDAKNRTSSAPSKGGTISSPPGQTRPTLHQE